MGKRYAIIGSGRQGTAAAYDLGRFGQAELLLMMDADQEQAHQAAARINRLLEQELAKPLVIDAANVQAVAEALKAHGIHAFLSGTPYALNLGLTKAAIQAGAGMTDLGGNSDVVQSQLALDHQAADAGITIVPDCGLGPGMTTSLSLYAMEQFDQPEEVYIWDCGLPQEPQAPWDYALTFSIEGLTNEYHGDCLFIRDGKTVRIPALEELETVHFPEPIGELEAFTTSGGVTTAAQTFAGVLKTLQNKTLRYPGHFAKLKVIQQLGLLDTRPVSIHGKMVAPREVLHALWEPQIRAAPDTRDLALIRILARGRSAGQPKEVQVDLQLRYDEQTGFTAMEQGTGWHASIITAAIAAGELRPGVIPVEKAMSGSDFVGRAALRGFEVHLQEHKAGPG